MSLTDLKYAKQRIEKQDTEIVTLKARITELEKVFNSILEDSTRNTPEQIGSVAQKWLNDIDAILAEGGKE